MNHKIKVLQLLANRDEKYKQIRQKYIRLENEAMEIIHQLPSNQQDAVWAFVFASDEMDYRLLEIACDYIRFLMRMERITLLPLDRNLTYNESQAKQNTS